MSVHNIPVVYDSRLDFQSAVIGIATITENTIVFEITNENYSMDDLRNIFACGFADKLELRVGFTPALNGANPPRDANG